MKATLATVATLFAASAIAIPSLHNPHHDRLHRRQGYGGGVNQPAVQYTTQMVSNVVTQYVNAQGQPTHAPAANNAPAQGSQGAPKGGQGGKQGEYSTMVTAANGQQVSAVAWNWGQPGGAHGVSWRYTQPAGGGWGGQYPHQQTSAAAPSDTAAAPSDATPAAQYTPPQQSQPAPAQPPAQSSAPAPAPQPQSSQQDYQKAPSSSPSSSPSGSSSASAPVNSGTSQWQNTVVEAHNIHRSNHSVPNIAWSDSLAKAAQMVANKCSFTHDLDTGKDICGFESYGQNFACTSGQDNIGEDITSEWYNEEGIYEISGSYGQANPNSYGDSETGHFTQLVWKASTHVGCAVAQCPNGVAGTSGMKELTVCDYGPEGNMGGEYATNVPKPKGLPSTKGAEKPQGYNGS